MFKRTVTSIVVLSLALVFGQPASAKGPEVVTLDAPSPLIHVRMMFKTGSAMDPAGKEGLAYVTAQAVLEGGYGDPGAPTTKEMVAKLTQRWGEGARPSVSVEKESTTFEMTVPRDVLDEALEKVLRPMFAEPLFLDDEIQRICNEGTTRLTGWLRYENLEMVGLEALDNYIFDGTSYAHTTRGTVRGLADIRRDDARKFFVTWYRPENLILGLTTSDRAVAGKIEAALRDSGDLAGVHPFSAPELRAPRPVEGRELTVVAIPDAGATGIHIGFPIDVSRMDDSYWPLYVGNVYFGTHRDSHSHLYKKIRQERGYNYGDYSYVEHFAWRPFALFPPFNTPRHQQYFSIWIRPVATDYAHHIVKAACWELEKLLREGVSDEDVELSKNKAKVLYLNLAETSSRLLAAKMDDAFYGMDPGYLEGYLERIDAVTTDQVNAALRNALQSDDLKIVIATEANRAQELAADIRANRNATGKSPSDYQIASTETEAGTVYEVPEHRLGTLARDAVWEHSWLDIDPARVRVVPVEALFETGAFVTDLGDAGAR